MQDMNPDMEELLQRASVDYPLKNGTDRWEEIAGRLSLPSVPTGKITHNHSNLYLKNGTLLLLLVLSWFVLKDTSSTFHTPIKKINHKNNTSAILKPKEGEPANEVNSTLLRPQLKQNFTSPGISNRQMDKPANFKMVKSIDQVYPGIAGDEFNKHSNLNIEQLSIPAEEVYGLKKTDRLLEPGNDRSAPVIMIKTRSKGFFFGFGASLGINAIKDQGFDKPSFKAGIMGGYRFNNRLSAESGLFFAKKYYSTGGEYFDMDNMHKDHPAVTSVMNVNGSSNLLEIPVILRYDIVRKSNSRFYSSIGFSSCLITMENNHYNVMMNGTEQPMHGSYTRDKMYYAASFDLGAGFEKDLSCNKHLRIEPYLQLPVNGIGVGKLYIKTLGIKVGLTRSKH